MAAESADDPLYRRHLAQDDSRFLTMIHHPPYITPSSSSSAAAAAAAPTLNVHQPPDNQRSNTGQASDRPAYHHGNQQQSTQTIQPSPSQLMQHVDGNVVLSSLHDFANFLGQFGRQTAPAIDSRAQRIEAMIAEHLTRTERAQHEHERRVGERVDSLSRNVRAACAFSEEDNHERDAALAKSISEAVVSAIAPRFDNLDCRLDETVTMTRALQTSVKSFDARLKKIENQASSSRISATLLNSSSPSTPPLARAEVPSNSSCDLDELRYELELLSKLVESTRREAHLDKEALSLAVSDKHREIASTLHNEFRALKNAVGIGKGSLRSNSLFNISLVERLDSLSADVRSVVERLKKHEVARPSNTQPPTELKEGLEQLARLAEAWSTPKKDRILRDAPVMTDVGEEVNTAINRSQSVPVQAAFSTAGISIPNSRVIQANATQNEDVHMDNVSDGNTTLYPQVSRIESESSSNVTALGSVPLRPTPLRASTNETVPVIAPPPGSTTSDSSTNNTSTARADVNLVPASRWTAPVPHQPLPSTPIPTPTSAVALSDQRVPTVATNVNEERRESSRPLLNERTETIQHAEFRRSRPSSVPNSSPPSASSNPRHTELQDAPSPLSSVSTATTTSKQRERLSHAEELPQTVGPATTLISPSPSSPLTSSPSSTSEQRRGAVNRRNTAPNESENESERSSENARPTFAELDRDQDPEPLLHDNVFYIDAPMSPVGPPAKHKVVHVIDLERSLSPLTDMSPLSSLDEKLEEDEDERESQDESSPAISRGSDEESPSRNRTSLPASSSKVVQVKPSNSSARSREKRTEPVPCPNGCRKVYTMRDTLRKHLSRDCPLVERETPSLRRRSRVPTASTRPAKKRKGTEERPRAFSDEGERKDHGGSEDELSPLSSVTPSLESPTRESSASTLQVVYFKRKNSSTKTEAKRTAPLPCPHGCGKVYSLRDSLAQHIKFRCSLAGRERDTPNVRRPSRASSASVRPTKKRKVADGGDRGTPSASRSKSMTPSEKKKEKGKKNGTKKPTTAGEDAQRKVITHVHPPEVLQNVDWPPKSMNDDMFDHQLLQCDRCDTSYHYRCVGVTRGDSRLALDAPFICPPCTHINDPQATINKHNGSCCGRPDCDWPGEACDDDSDYFVVERILGRRLANASGPPESAYKWLVKWSGYPISECDWLEETGLPEADKLISKYYADAAAQSMIPHDDDKVYLLKEAHSKLHEAMQKKWKWIV